MCVMRQPTRLLRMALAGLLALLWLPSVAMATGAYGEYLSPDQAFQLQAEAVPGAVVLQWQIADGYYLYRDKIMVTATPAVIANICLPPGEVEVDPYFGRTTIYRHAARVVLPLDVAAAADELALTVTYQGCAEAGLCYPPIVKHLTVATQAGADTCQTLEAAPRIVPASY